MIERSDLKEKLSKKYDFIIQLSDTYLEIYGNIYFFFLFFECEDCFKITQGDSSG